MFKFEIPEVKPDLMGGFIVGDESNKAWVFSQRFGNQWLKAPKSKGVYVIFDKKDKVVVSIKGNELAFYFHVTRSEFIESWNGNKALIAGNAFYVQVDPTYKWVYLQIEKVLKENGLY